MAAMAIAAPVAGARNVVGDNPATDQASVPRSTQGSTKPNKPNKPRANPKPKPCPGSNGRTLARAGCVK